MIHHRGGLAVEGGLKNCPFCEGEGWVWLDRKPPKLHVPRCRKCGADLGGFPTEAEAVTAWNTRAPSDAALVEALEVAIDLIVDMSRQRWCEMECTEDELVGDFRAALAAAKGQP
jgi:hypothetical protein